MMALMYLMMPLMIVLTFIGTFFYLSVRDEPACVSAKSLSNHVFSFCVSVSRQCEALEPDFLPVHWVVFGVHLPVDWVHSALQ